MLVYRVTNTVNGKTYIGLTKGRSPRRRWARHVWNAVHEPKYHLSRAINKYGREAFRVETLAHAETYEQLKCLEQLYIRVHASNDKAFGYNRTPGGDGHLGWKPSPETRAKLSAALKGRGAGIPVGPRAKPVRRPHTESTKQKIAAGKRRAWARLREMPDLQH